MKRATADCRAVAAMLLGDQARVMLRPSSAYGEERKDCTARRRPGRRRVTLTAVLFNLAATPEKENHGAVPRPRDARFARGIAVLVDESSFVERLGGPDGPHRMNERIALWQQFCNFHHAPATIVNLLDPARRPLERRCARRIGRAMTADPVQIQFALISHTNNGKTTLARTLVGVDVGEVRDAAHVTVFAESHPLLTTDAGDSLHLWDTPGFGDSVRLLQRSRSRAIRSAGSCAR